MKKGAMVIGLAGYLFFIAGCLAVPKTKENLKELHYEVMDVRTLPTELEALIEERKEEAFELVYGDMESRYLVKGYGEKAEEGYCIEIKQCAENDSIIYLQCVLHGPGGEGMVCETKYPFCVIKVKDLDKPVVFEE